MNNLKTDLLFSERMNHIPQSFIREILKVTTQPDIISFAGGLPNPAFFPIDAIQNAALKVLQQDGKGILQYGVTEGYFPLRQLIAERYQQKGLKITAEEIIITNGSQQALDLIGKVFINPGDKVLMERPTYLGAIQAFSAYQPDFITVDLTEDGVDTAELETSLLENKVKLFYAIPNFQNPTGITWSEDNRKEVCGIIKKTNTIVIEDDPYGEIKFSNHELTPIKKYLGEQSILLGSFSKMISPGLRLGWIVAPPSIAEKIVLAKQASDLHSNNLSQRIVYQYLIDNRIEDHLDVIRKGYKFQKDKMTENIAKYFPKEVKHTDPRGGMFIWVTLPKSLSSYKLLEIVSKEKIVFVPGEIFYINSVTQNTFRLNFSNSSVEEIELGVRTMGRVLQELI